MVVDLVLNRAIVREVHLWVLGNWLECERASRWNVASAVQDRDDTYYSCIVMIRDPVVQGGKSN